MSFTARQLEAGLRKWEKKAKLDDELFMSLWYEEHIDLPNLDGIGQVEVVECWGGEGQGQSMGVIIKVGNRYFRMCGYYSSWDDSEMDGNLEEVKPVEVTRTEYVGVKSNG